MVGVPTAGPDQDVAVALMGVPSRTAPGPTKTSRLP